MTILVKELHPHICVLEKNKSPNRHTKKTVCVCVCGQPACAIEKNKNNRNNHWLHKIDNAFWYGKGKPTWTCLKLHWFQKEVQLYVSLWVNDPTSRLFYYLNKQFSNEFMASIVSLKSSVQHDVLGFLVMRMSTLLFKHGHFWCQKKSR